MQEEKINYQSPIYLQLREVIRNKIEDGEYLPGTAIPSENELAEKYKINRMTVRNAIDLLVREGALIRVAGKDVFVVGNRVERDLEVLNGFTQVMVERKLKPSTKVLSKIVRKAGEKYALIFDIDPDDEIFYIKRLCLAGGEPIALEEIFIPKYIVPELIEIDLGVFSIFEIYDFYNVNMVTAKQTIDIVNIDSKDAKLLNIEQNMSVMLFECTSYDDKKRVIESSKSYTRGDKSLFNVHFNLDE